MRKTVDSSLFKEIVEIGDEVLRIENLTIPSPVTKNKNIIDNISFYVRSGEILALAGLVGAGRSETVNAIFGSIRKTSGDIYINNVKVNINSPKDAIEAGIGLVTEDRKINGIIPEFSIKKNISIASLDDFGTKVWMNNKAEAEAANESMKSLSIKAPSVDSMILSLSGGNQQKVVLAKWLIKNLKVLILDEPTRGIDVGAKTQLYNIITELVKKGMAIIMISSELPELVAMCDRMYVLAEGKIQAELCDDNISENNMMKAATGY